MKRKRIILAVLCLLLLAGCGGSETQEASNETQSLTIALWDYDKTSYDRKLVKAFEESHPDVEIEVISYPDTYYDEKLETLMVSGRQVDVFFVRATESLRRLCNYGVVAPLNSLVARYGHDLEDTSSLDLMRDGDTLYSVPYRLDRYVLLYNCDLFDAAGIAYPKENITWEELETLANQLQQKLSADTYALMVLPMDVQWIASGWFRTFDYTAQTTEYLRPIMELALRLQASGAAPQYGDCIAQNIQQQCFALGNYGMYVGGSWYINYLTSDQLAGRFDFRWGVTTAPHWADNPESNHVTIQTGLSISASSQNQELAWEFIQFAAGKEGAKIMAEEQMLPAYMDDDIVSIYQSHFTGTELRLQIDSDFTADSSHFKSQTQYTQDIVFDEFRQCMIGEKTVDEALEDMNRLLEDAQAS